MQLFPRTVIVPEANQPPQIHIFSDETYVQVDKQAGWAVYQIRDKRQSLCDSVEKARFRGINAVMEALHKGNMDIIYIDGPEPAFFHLAQLITAQPSKTVENIFNEFFRR